ncbi:hypothetical protein D3C80_711990 [compost metagenome]
MFLIDQGNPFGGSLQFFIELNDLASKVTPRHLAVRMPGKRVFVDVVGRCHIDGLHPHTLGVGRPHQRQQVESALGIVAGPDVEFSQVVLQLFGHFAGSGKRVQIKLIDVGQQFLQVQRLHAAAGQGGHVFDQELLTADTAAALANDQSRFFRECDVEQFGRCV